MRKIALVLSVLVLGGWWHSTQNGVPPVAGGPLGGYSGPGDTVGTWTAWYGLRAFSAAVAGAGSQKMMNLRRASDNETCDVKISTTDGGLGNTVNCSLGDNAISVATFLTSTTGFVTTWYDQSGNGRDMVQATTGAQPQLLLTGCTSGSLPCLKFVAASSQFLASTSFPTLSQPFSMAVVANYVSGSCGAAQCELLSTNAGGGTPFEFQTGIAYVYGGGAAALTGTAAATTWHAITTVWNDASGTNLDIDGTTATASAGTFGTLGTSSSASIGAISGPSRFLNGNITEVGMVPSGFSGANQTALNSQLHTYWGF